jgi:hypothetical protein
MKLSAFLLLLVFGLAYGQVELAYGQVETVTGTLGITASCKVKDMPFSADLINNDDLRLPDGKELHDETQAKMYRDSEGRTRTDQHTIVDGKDRIDPSIIIDPLQQTIVQIDHNSKTATIFHGTRPPAPPESEPSQVKPSYVPERFPGESLGTMTLEGFAVSGKRYTRREEPPDRHEWWFTDDLGGLVLLMKYEYQQPGIVVADRVITARLTNIRKGEPDSALFQIPAGYTVNDGGIYPQFLKHKNGK